MVYAHKKPEKPKPLLYRKNNQWKGSFIKQLPGIFNWVYSLDLDEAREALIEGTLDERHKISNPLKLWIQESLEEGQGAFLGYSTRLNPKVMKEASKEG